jgi:Kef-type K+ transport system membrane component KefB
MHESVFSELSLLIAIAAGIALIMRLIRQPLIIGHILTGIIVGPSVLHLIKSPETIEAFSSIGIALLLFIIGLGLNPRVIKEIGKVAAIGGITEVVVTTALGWSVGILLGLPTIEALFLGVALSFSSTIIILKLLSDRKEQSRLYGKIVTGFLLIEDILAALALLFVTAQAGQGDFSLTQLGILIGKGALISIPLLIIGNRVLPHLHKLIAGSQEFLFLFAIGWGFGSAALFELIGFSLEIGALIAGIALASLPYTQEISSRLRPLRDFFIVVFFISLGARLAFGDVLSLLPLIIASCIIVVLLRPMIILAIMGLLGYTKGTSFKAAISMTQLSEFSLVFMILGNTAGFVSDQLVVIVTISALTTIAVSTYLITYNDRVFAFLENTLSMFERRKTHFEQESKQHYELVLFGYQKGGHEFVNVFKNLKKRFVVIDYNPEVIDLLEHRKVQFLYGDATDIELLEEAGIDRSKLIISTITDHEVNLFLIRLLEKINPKAVVILHADNVEEAAQLYELGASYVVIPHYIGSEKISSFIKKSGLKKSEFRRYREKHLAYLQSHYPSNSRE